MEFPHFDQFWLLVAGAFVGAGTAIVPLFIAMYVFFQRFATKEELLAADQRSRDRYAENKQRYDGVEARHTANMSALEARITAAVGENRNNNEHRFGELKSSVDNLTRSVQLFTIETAKSTGNLEGKVTLMERRAGAAHEDTYRGT